jgi:putative Ca2+/H+ antiporter (TMEM165/GDT1 family)
VFITTVIAFFLVEMVTRRRSPRWRSPRSSSARHGGAGTTHRHVARNVPVVFAGDALIRRVPLKVVRIAAALTFVALGPVRTVSG